MCGRYTLEISEEDVELRAIVCEVERRLREGGRATVLKRDDIRPTDLAPVLAPARSGRLEARAMVWGYPAHRGSGVIFNARSETAAQSPMWSASLATRRCVVPAAGFYEWQHVVQNSQLSFLAGQEEAPERVTAVTKEKYRFTLPGRPVLYMAGIYQKFRGHKDGEREHFSLLTTAANASMKAVHDRMPVVLLPEEVMPWLEGGTAALFDRSRLMLNKERVAG